MTHSPIAKDPLMHPTLRSASHLDRQAHLRGDDAALARLRTAPDTRFLVLVGGKPAIVSNTDRTTASIRWLTSSDIAALRDYHAASVSGAHTLFLGVDPGTGAARFAIALPENIEGLLAGLLQPILDLRSLATQGVMDADQISMLGNAKALADWHASSSFCSRCGTASVVGDGGWRRVCPSCGFKAFPRTDPVVIMLITDGERCVITREPRFPERMYSLPAGYIEPGEDIENAVTRETQEELGITVHDVSYRLSQPWPFPHSLMIGCLARTEPAGLRPDPAEIDDAKWVNRDEVASMVGGTHPQGLWVPGAHAIAHSLISRWLTATSS